MRYSGDDDDAVNDDDDDNDDNDVDKEQDSDLHTISRGLQLHRSHLSPLRLIHPAQRASFSLSI
jgi:hypothetical protein